MDTRGFGCLDEYVNTQFHSTGTFTCPVCSIELPTPADGGITKCGDNQHIKVNQIMQTVRDVQVLCEIGDEKLHAVHRCIECEQNFCNTCSKVHLRMNIAKSHKLVNLRSHKGRHYLVSIGYCDKHKNEKLTFYCRTCMVPVCMRCHLTVHEDQTTEDVVDFATKTRIELKLVLGIK